MSMKFITASSVVGVILLSIAGSLCQLDVCGRASLNVRIVGGEDATAGSWPWQVSIDVHEYFCGGTLINKDWVLSAAHCFDESSNISDPDTVMYFGRLNQSGSNPHEIIRTASRIIRHSNYNSSTKNNDIALIQLNSSVLFSDYIKPVCLAAAGSVFSAGTESWVTGWGRLQYNDTEFPDILQEVMIPVVNNSDCDKAYEGFNMSITSNMICAGLLNQGGKHSCHGDSGGPMVSKKDSLWIQSGIVSFGEGCAEPEYPGVYTRVSQYQNWIKSYMSSNTPGFVEFKSDVQQSTPTTNPTTNPTKTPTTNPTPTPTTNPTKTPILTSNSSFRSAPNLLLFSLSLMFSIIPFTFSLFLSS